MKTIYFITHPDVVIDHTMPIPNWPLSEKGKTRMNMLLTKRWVQDVQAVYCSTEQKAIDGARILAKHCSLSYEMHEELGEMDRSSTGFLPREEFEATADRFFANPHESVRGWETAVSAQQRIVNAINAIVQKETSDHMAIVSHGGVGALYLCHLKQCPIDRVEDQPDTEGGNYFVCQPEAGLLLHGWELIDG